jgi:hypothetical protein
MADDPILVYVASSLPRRYCTAASPMQAADKDKYQWGHPDAAPLRPWFNLVIYLCPHCALEFHAPPRPSSLN